jgi:hypothetical protein
LRRGDVSAVGSVVKFVLIVSPLLFECRNEQAFVGRALCLPFQNLASDALALQFRLLEKSLPLA